MRVWDAELLTAKSGVQPITENLLISLDALDFVDQSSNFTDRFTGKTIVPKATQYHSISKLNNVLSIDCIKTTIGQTNINFSSIQQLSGVRCVDFTFKAAGRGVIDGRIRFGEYVSSVLDCGNTANNYLTFDDVMHHYTIYTDGSSVKAFTDCVLTGGIDNKNPYDTNVFLTVYCYYRAITHLFDIGSLRVYAAPLTEDQMLKNHQYEISVGRITL